MNGGRGASNPHHGQSHNIMWEWDSIINMHKESVTSFNGSTLLSFSCICSRRKLSDVRAMADMLKRFNEIVDSETTESEYLWHSLRPYWGYFVSLIVVVLTFSFADNLWIPCPELAYISGLLAVACFLALGDNYDYLVVLSIACNLLSTLPVFFEAFPRIPVLHPMLQLLFGSVFSLQIAPGLFINFGLPSMAYLAVPLLFARMAQRKSWQGTYRVLIPHLVCFFWWQLLVMFYRYTSWYGLLRASVGWIGAVFLSPLLVVGLVVWAGAYVVRLLTVVNLLRLLTTVGLLAIPAGVAFWAKSGFRVSRFSISHGSTKAKIALFLLFVASSVPLAYVFAPLEMDVSGPSLTWPQYRSLCSRPQWERTNIADTMVACSHLTGVVVDWTASVKKIVVKRIDNQAETFLALLPWSVSDPIRCAYGQEYPECSSVDDPRERLLCDVSTMQGRKCHIKNLNRYTFELWARLPMDDNADNGTEFHDVRITASHWYKDVLMPIKDGELVHIRAMLMSELGNMWPVLKLYHIACESCAKPVTFSHTGMTEDSLNILRRLARAVFEMCNFFTYPVVQIKYKITDS